MPSRDLVSHTQEGARETLYFLCPHMKGYVNYVVLGRCNDRLDIKPT